MGTVSSKTRSVLAALLAALVGPLTASVLTIAAPTAAGADTAGPATPVGGTVAGGYVLGASDGGVYNFGAHDFGSMGGKTLAEPIVGMASTPTGEGYWMVASDGGIFSFGDAAFHGSTGNIALNKPIVGMASTATGQGYWFVAEDGGIFAFGDAAFYGSTGNITLAKPIVGMASTATGQGYWFVAEDGGIFAFGDAAFYGSTGNITLAKPIVGMAATPTGAGYWMVASDGGIFAFGDARFFGSTGAVTLAKPIVDMAATPTGEGYWLVAEDGGIFTFGNAAFKGSTGATRLNGKIVDLLPQGGDITAPKLHSLAMSPVSVDTSVGSATITVTARLTDALSGVAGEGYTHGATEARFTSPSGGQFVDAVLYKLTSGDAHDGTYSDTMTIPGYAEQGTWTLQYLAPVDQVGNRTTLNAATLAAAGYPTTFTQTGRGDSTAPALRAFSFTPSSVDTSAGPQTITVTARLTDDLSGVAGEGYTHGATEARFMSPSGGQFVDAVLYHLTSGDAHDGTYQATMTLPASAEQGTWTLQYLAPVDQAGNRTTLNAATLAAAGYPTTFEVVRTG